MSLELIIRNRQRTRAVNTRLLRKITTTLLRDQLAIQTAELGITLVAAPEMARVNWQFLQHEGSTDVITFDYSAAPELRPPAAGAARTITGEIFVCVDDAITQAKQFRSTWPAEVVRYVVHGILHLLGYDDRRTTARQRMKREENRLVRRLAQQFSFRALAK